MLSQERMNLFEKIVNIKAAPSDDLDFPKRSQIQGIISIHECNFSSDEGEGFRGLERKTFDSPHFSIAALITSGLSTSLSLVLNTVRSSMVIAATELRNAAPKLERT